MHFEAGQLYHIYNQGNNQQRVFFERENQLFFLKKIRIYVLPFADVLAWCLMPNHFHLMVYVRTVGSANESRAQRSANEGFTLSEALIPNEPCRTFNDSIGLMLRSYTRAINIQEGRTGALFRKATKAECITGTDEGITPSFYKTNTGTSLNLHEAERSYPKICFDYIHQNPVVAALCNRPEDWEFSSFQDYCGKRDGKLVHKSRAKEFGL